ECTAQAVDAVVVLQTTMGDGRLAPALTQLWPDPILLWATPENQEGDMISSCSLVGTHCWASVLRQSRHAFEVIYGDPDHGPTQQQLAQAVRMASTVRRLRQVKLGLVGGYAPGYVAMAAEPFVMQHALGVHVQNYSLIDFGNIVKDLSDAAVAEDVAKFKQL